MELRQLRYFVAVAEELSYVAAAERLQVSKATLSQQISVLERSLGRRLLNRTSRSVSLTPAGAASLDHARRVLTQCEQLQHAVTTAAYGDRPFDVRVVNGVQHVVSAGIRALQRHREMVVTLTMTSMLDAEDAVAAGRADAAIGWVTSGIHTMLHVTPIASSSVCLAVPEDHILAQLDVVPVAKLASESVALFPRRLAPAIWDVLAGHLLPGGGKPGQILDEISSLHPMQSMLLAAREGRAVAPFVKVVADAIAPDGVALRPLDPPLELPVVAITREERRPEVRELIAVLLSAADAEPS